LTDTTKYPVNAVQCSTCVFRPPRDGGIHLTPARHAEIRQNLLNGINQICHHGSKSICRGGRDYQLEIFHRLGLIDAPTDEALAARIQEART
jgi:hypothetical protein